ncbi:Mu-like prophage FluMu protein gp45 [Bibersteinia trehalosi USDA-ARS-USMARC-189]|uniref:Mu-like prophage FluMu protein gp45 n=1 Tax=Bibersteinia trehalosi USDA-ARS-USMARC-189 TaxID=1263831 RepID=A0ABM5PAM3_BIBTR|nr:phage baseplate assembly protein V [Bibersteinia trehalosi]AGH39025.1 Mu-like prophage FluMu protein gp45 [Bibersteinia trehalosi USDA-ARS-USMARC-192]AHG83441.1 Mu-like prophage FluMu protein gp45 [Bibersteinia trehalosi USDA-ARS-USMARC-189]
MQALNRMIAPIKRGLQLLVSRAVVSVVNDAYARQNLQLRLQSDEVADDVERFQNYGHYSVPKAGEAIVVSVGGKRSHLVAVVVDDKSVRPAGLIAGDSVLYHLEGHHLRLTENGEAILSCKKLVIETETLGCSATEITFDSPQTTFTGDVDIMGISTAADHQSGGISGKDHDHEQKVGKPVSV